MGLGRKKGGETLQNVHVGGRKKKNHQKGDKGKRVEETDSTWVWVWERRGRHLREMCCINGGERARLVCPGREISRSKKKGLVEGFLTVFPGTTFPWCTLYPTKIRLIGVVELNSKGLGSTEEPGEGCYFMKRRMGWVVGLAGGGEGRIRLGGE